MENKYWKITIEPGNFFHDDYLHKHIKKNYWYFYSCLYGNMYISNIPSKSTYTFELSKHKRVYENTPAPNLSGHKMFDLTNKSTENLTVFIKVRGEITNSKLTIILPEGLFNRIVMENNCDLHNVFLLCKTSNEKYFVHISAMSIDNFTSAIKKVDSNMFYDKLNLANGHHVCT